MKTPFFGELLILFLLILSCSRMFFLRYSKRDSLAVLPLLCIVLSVCHVLAWGVNLFILAILLVSIFAFFTNFRALLRFSGGLFVDHYSMAFKVGAILTILLSVFLATVIIYFRPVIQFTSPKQVQVSKQNLSGNFSTGFSDSEALELTTNQLYVYEPANIYNKKFKPVLILSDKRADFFAYDYFAKSLAKSGYTVYIAEFFTKENRYAHNVADIWFLRNFFLQESYFKNAKQFEMQKEFFSYNISKEAQAMIAYIQQKESFEDSDGNACFEPVFICGDWMADIYLDDCLAQNAGAVCGTTKLTEEEGFATPGFGFAELTNPFLAFRLGKTNLRNKTGFEQTVRAIESKIPAPVYDRKVLPPQEDFEGQAADSEQTATDAEDAAQGSEPSSNSAQVATEAAHDAN